MSISAQIRIRRDTAANFTSANPTLALGEIAYETDTGNLKVGTGSTAWTALDYVNPFRGNAGSHVGNTSLGFNAGALLNANPGGAIAIGANALDAAFIGNANTAIGADALTNTTAGAFGSGTITAPGTNGLSGGSGSVSNVPLEKDSGTDQMTTYPTVHLTIVNGAVTGVVLAGASFRGTGATGSDIVMKPTAAGIALGAPSDFRISFSQFSGLNTAVGSLALRDNTVGAGNCAVGFGALMSNTTGSYGVAMGQFASYANVDGAQNVAVGLGALQSNVSGSANVAIGSSALALSTTSDQVAVGALALDANTTGTDNVAVGRDALGANTTGANAVAVGNNAGHNFGTAALPNTDLVTSATGSIFIGRDARPSANTQTNQIVIGYQGRGNGSNTTTIGNSSTTGTFIPAGRFTVSSTEASTSTTTGALVVGGGAGIGGNLSMSAFTEGVVAIGTVGASHTLDITGGTVQTATLTASTATTFTMPTAVAGKSFTLFLKQAATTGNGTATFTGVKWNAATPTMTATAGKMDIFSFISDGTNWYGSVIQGFTP